MKTYNEYGEINLLEFLSYQILLLLLTYFVCILIYAYNVNDLEFSLNNSILILSTYYKIFFNSIIDFFYNNHLSNQFIEINKKIIFFTIIPPLLYTIKTIYFSNIQKKLSSMGLEQYYLKYQWFNTYIFKLTEAEKIDFDKFVKNFENSKQLFNKDSVSIQRYKKNCVKVIFKSKFPTIKNLSKKNILKYLKKDKVFLGFTYGIKPVYISIHKILHLANLGTSGGGKSNTLNMIILSLLYNLDLIEKIIFVDFKGGIEAAPYSKLKNKKIKTLNSSRIELLEELRVLNQINKERQQNLIKIGQKQYKKDYIFLLLDEVAEILNYTPKDKADKEVQTEIQSIIQSLFQTGRSQGIRIFISTQSFVGNASGLTGSMKNNILTKILHLTQSKEALDSVFQEKDKLEKEGLNPADFTIGEFVLDTEGNDLIHSRSIYIPENINEYISLLQKII